MTTACPEQKLESKSVRKEKKKGLGSWSGMDLVPGIYFFLCSCFPIDLMRLSRVCVVIGTAVVQSLRGILSLGGKRLVGFSRRE